MPTAWPASFSRAIVRRRRGFAATNSRLPRRASVASVPDRATIDHSPTMIGKKAAVFVREIAAERLDVDRLTRQALEDRWHGVHDGRQFLAGRCGRELGHDGLADRDQEEAHAETGQEHRPARVADGLAEDAAQAE